MTRILRDSIDPDVLVQFPAPLIGGYDDGIFGPNHAAFGQPGWDAPQWDRFPNAIHVHIAVFASTNSGQVGDCETGDMTPQQAPGWVRLRRAAGQDPTMYHSFDGWAALRDEFAAQGVAEPWWWIAYYGIPPRLFTQDDRGRDVGGRCVAHQYAGSAETGHNYDESLVADHWPGVDMALDPSNPTDAKVIQAADFTNGVLSKFVSDVEYALITGDPDFQDPKAEVVLNTRAILKAVQALQTPTVDVNALAAALAPHLPAATDPDVVAQDVVAKLAAQLGKP